MKNVEERAKLDEYEMKEHYDFSNGVRGRFYQTEKVKTTLPLDADILIFLKQQADEKHLDYPLFVNALLREYMNNSGKQHHE